MTVNNESKSFTKIKSNVAASLADNTMKWICIHREINLDESIKNTMSIDHRKWWQKLFRQKPIYLNREQALELLKFRGEWCLWSKYDRIMLRYDNLYQLAENVKYAADHTGSDFMYINVDELKVLSQ